MMLKPIPLTDQFDTEFLSQLDCPSLIEVARILYPHEALPDSVYEDVLVPLAKLALSDARLGVMLQLGLVCLSKQANGDWRSLSQPLKMAAIEDRQNSVFITTIKDAVREGLYDHPAVWSLINYEGSSLEAGGYIGRGFGELDWLPNSDNE